MEHQLLFAQPVEGQLLHPFPMSHTRGCSGGLHTSQLALDRQRHPFSEGKSPQLEARGQLVLCIYHFILKVA